ncbi:MAG: TetR/AcrR family transcriptional regulator [Alphaproteobacteria bacterium]|nr:TetR/AcrR family transcriptional regulator [Alphaproteobacteria bacterium]
MAQRRRKPKATRATSGESRAAPDRAAVIDAALSLFATRGWRETTLADIAQAAGTGLAAVYPMFPSKVAVLRGFMARIDAAVLAAPTDADGTVRERLFEIFMRRFDALQPNRTAMQALARDLPRDPCAALCIAQRAGRSLRAMAELSGVRTDGPLGVLRVKALVALHLWVMRAWLGDESADMARTMKALDQGLDRLEMLARSLPGARRETEAAAPG